MKTISVLVVELAFVMCILTWESVDANPYGWFLEVRRNTGCAPSIEHLLLVADIKKCLGNKLASG